MPYIVEAFMQQWETLPLLLDDPRVRYYDFQSEEVPHCTVIGELARISATDPIYIVNIIQLIDLIVTFDETPLENPDDPVPDR